MSPAASAALFRRAWLMIVSMQIVVLPVERSPMISSRWPRPIGIIASIGHDAGLHRLADRVGAG